MNPIEIEGKIRALEVMMYDSGAASVSCAPARCSPARMVEQISEHLKITIAETHRRVTELSTTLGLSYADTAESIWWQLKRQKPAPLNAEVSHALAERNKMFDKSRMACNIEHLRQPTSKATLAAPAGSAADDLLRKNIERLRKHREMWRVSRGNMATLPSDGQCEMIIEDLEKCRLLMRQNAEVSRSHDR